MSHPSYEFEPQPEPIDLLPLDRLLADAESLKLRMQNNRGLAEQLATHVERYLGDKLLSGEPVSVQEHDLTRTVSLLCHMTGIEVPLFIDTTNIA